MEKVKPKYKNGSNIISWWPGGRREDVCWNDEARQVMFDESTGEEGRERAERKGVWVGNLIVTSVLQWRAHMHIRDAEFYIIDQKLSSLL